MTGPCYDAFLSHHSPDKPAVVALAQRLEAAGIHCWLDKWNLIPGDACQPAMVDALRDCKCCVVFFGPSRGGPWQNEELQTAIAQCVEQPGTYRVLPVLLPGARKPDRSLLPAFLENRLPVEFADTLDDADAFHQLVCGIRGVAPGIGPAAPTSSNEEPYRGLEPFLEQHARFFFGREAQIQVLLDKLRDGLQKPDAMRFLAIVGASGSGKSSLAQAGLIPALRRGSHRGSSQWPVIVLRPGARPLESLAVALAGDPHLGAAVRDPLALCDQLAQDPRRLHMTILQALRGAADSHRAVLVVDQFEETFTLCPDEDAASRVAFIDNLLHAATVYGGRTVVVLTMRADFYECCAAHARLAAAVSDHQDLVPPLEQAQLREAIERPAALCGAELEPGLADDLVHDMRGQTGALPLLQHTLHELWERRSGRRLTHTAYGELGRLHGALERRAEEIYAGFAPAEQDLCRRIFLRLTQLGRGTEDTKRRVAVSELSSATASRAEIEQVLARLAAERLVTMSGTAKESRVQSPESRAGAERLVAMSKESRVQSPESRAGAERTVEVAHEALIRTWGRLRQWIDSRRELLLCRDRLGEAARTWQDNACDVSFLYHGTPLEQADQLARDPDLDLTPLEQEFLDASVTHLVEQLADAETGRVPTLIEQLAPLAERARPRLVAICQGEPPESRRRLHAALAQCSHHTPRDESPPLPLLDFLLDRLLHAELPDSQVLIESLAAYRPQLVDRLWETLEDRSARGDTAARFRAALALAAYDPPADEAAASRWGRSAEAVARQLVEAAAANPSHYARLLEAVRPLRVLLREPLGQLFRHEEDPTRRSWATSLAVDLAAEVPAELVNLVVDADPRQFGPVFARLEGHAPQAAGLLTSRLAERADDNADDAVKETLARRQANAGVALVRLGKVEPVWPQLRFEPDPRRRSYLIHGLAALGADAGLLLSRLQQETDVSARRALILTLGEMAARLSGDQREALVRLLADTCRDDPDPGVHGAARWSLLQLDQRSRVAEVEQQLATGETATRDGRGCGQSPLVREPSGTDLDGDPGSRPVLDGLAGDGGRAGTWAGTGHRAAALPPDRTFVCHRDHLRYRRTVSAVSAVSARSILQPAVLTGAGSPHQRRHVVRRRGVLQLAERTGGHRREPVVLPAQREVPEWDEVARRLLAADGLPLADRSRMGIRVSSRGHDRSLLR